QLGGEKNPEPHADDAPHHRHNGELADHLVVVGGTDRSVHGSPSTVQPKRASAQDSATFFAWSYRQTKSEASMDKQHMASIDGDQWARCVAQQGWLWTPAQPGVRSDPATLILAHGAGAPMDSGFM